MLFLKRDPKSIDIPKKERKIQTALLSLIDPFIKNVLPGKLRKSVK